MSFARAMILAGLAGAVVLTAGSGAARAQDKSSGSGRLSDAYKREFAFLESEKRQLQQRLAADKKQAEARLAAARNEIEALQTQVVSASSEAERLAELVLAAERDIDALDQSENVGEDLALRADSVYQKIGMEIPDADPAVREQLLAQLAFVFDNAPKALTRQGQIRVTRGSYFDGEGVKVEGRIVEVGDIASYGLVDGAQGPLAPAGGGRLKLWPTGDGAAAAQTAARGGGSGSLPIFLYESLDKGIERKPDKTWMEIVETGGIIGWVIFFLGLLAAAMIVARAGILAWISRGTGSLVGPVLVQIARGNVANATAVASKSRSSAGRVLKATCENLGRSREEIEDVVAEAVLQEQPHLQRFGSSIMVVAAVSPLLGLLGTVTGMISTFEVITEFGTGNPKLLSGGISEALITTELGLIVAIPALLCGHILTGWSERIRDNLDAAALAAVNRAAGLAPPSDDDQLPAERDELPGREEIAA